MVRLQGDRLVQIAVLSNEFIQAMRLTRSHGQLESAGPHEPALFRPVDSELAGSLGGLSQALDADSPSLGVPPQPHHLVPCLTNSRRATLHPWFTRSSSS